MDANYILIWLVGISCVSAMARAWKGGARFYHGWIITTGMILLLLIVGFILFPEVDGYVGTGAWSLFVLAPTVGTRLLWRWTMQQRYALAWRAAVVLRCLHPFGAERVRPSLLRAALLAQEGRLMESERILQRLIERGGISGCAAQMQWCRLTGRWAELVAWVEENVGQKEIRREAGLWSAYVRALGENGQMERMLWVYTQYGDASDRAAHVPSWELCRLIVLSFCGRHEAVALLLKESLEWLPENAREFWRATAESASGDPTAIARSSERFQRLLVDEKDAVLRAAIEKRLNGMTIPVLSETGWLLLGNIEKEERVETVSVAERFGWRKAHVTLVLVGLNAIMFVWEILAGGSENEPVLFAMGALSPEAVVAGGWWRLLASMFLHCGPIHLVMNMAGLLLLGPFVEERLGRWRYAVTYLVSGLGSMGLVVLLVQVGFIKEGLFVGASGSIMGLVGATAMVWLQRWRTERSDLAKRRLQRILMAVGLQVVFDLVTPQVSMAAHMSGAFVGALMTWFLTRNVTAEESDD